MSFRKSEYFKTTRITVVFAAAAIAISIVVLSGWVFDIEVLTSIHDKWVSLKVNAAIATIFAVSSLLMFTLGRKKGLASFLAVGTYLIGFVTLSEYLFDWNANIDELLFKDTKTPAELYPGRMAPLAAIGFILIGISILFFQYKQKKIITDFFAIIVLIVSFLAFIGYMYNAKSFYTITYLNSISVSATLVLFFLSLAILFSKPETGLMAVFSEKTRPVILGARQILFLIIILLVFGWLCLKGYDAGYYDMKFGISIMVVAFSGILFFTSTAGIRNLNTIENERDRLYKANQEKAKQIKDVFERVSDAFMALDKNWRFVYVNKKAGELSKRNPADIIGKNIWEEFPEAVGSDTYKAYHKAMADQQYASNTDYNGLLELWYESNIYPSPEGLSIFIRDINEIKTAEKALEESANHLRTIYETEPECIKLLGPAGELLEMNPAGLTMIEADNLEMVKGKSLLGIIAPKYRDAFSRLTQNVFNGESGVLQFEITGLKGTHRMLETHAVPLKDSGGKIISLLSVTRDVTERSKAEQAIKESEEKFRTLVQQAAEGIFIVDMDGNYLEANESAARLTGYSQEELKKMNAREIVDSDDLKKNPIRLEEIMTGKSVFIERIIRKKDKTLFNAEISTKLMNNGKVISIMRDVTERKLAEERIKESEAKYRSLMQQAGDSIVLFDNTGQLLDVNESALQLLGYSGEEYKKMSLKDFVFEKDLKENAFRFDLLNKGEPTITRRKLKRKEGFGVEVELHVKKLSDGRYLGVARDLTERIKAEKKIFEKDQQLREISSAIPGFIYQFALEPTGEFHFPFISESARTLIGVSPEEVYENVGNAFAKVHPDDMPGLFESIYASANTLTPWSYVFKVIEGPDKPIKWIRGNSIPKKMENGSIIWNGAMFDITELKLAEEKIKESEGKYRNMVERNLAGIYQTSYEGKILTCNEAFARMLGYTSKYLQQQNAEILYFSKTGRNEFINRIQRTGEIFNHEIKLKHSDGSSVYMIENCYLHTNPQTSEQVIEGVVIDITKRKKAEQELEESYKSIRRLTEYLQEVREEERTYIAREIHDELGQQLTVMMMDVAWLNKKIGTENVGVSDKIKELLEMLDNTVKTVRRISTELRPSLLDDLGLVPAMEMHLKDFEARSAILTQLIVPKQDLELSDSVKNALFRIFQESLTNVARHSGAEKVVAMLEVNDDNIVLTIEDNGTGFDEREAATKKTLGVLGMKERAAVIGGEYHISGKPGKGTTIRVRVPLYN